MKIIVTLVILLSVFGISLTLNYSPNNQYEESEKTFCTADAKQCQDGSYVSRTGPKCEFAKCPNTGLVLSVKLNQKVQFENISITPLKVVSDSRCPIGVQCVWAGTVNVKVKFEKDGESDEIIVEIGKKIEVFGLTVYLNKVLPEKDQNDTLDEDYIFIFGENIELM